MAIKRYCVLYWLMNFLIPSSLATVQVQTFKSICFLVNIYIIRFGEFTYAVVMRLPLVIDHSCLCHQILAYVKALLS